MMNRFVNLQTYQITDFAVFQNALRPFPQGDCGVIFLRLKVAELFFSLCQAVFYPLFLTFGMGVAAYGQPSFMPFMYDAVIRG